MQDLVPNIVYFVLKGDVNLPINHTSYLASDDPPPGAILAWLQMVYWQYWASVFVNNQEAETLREVLKDQEKNTEVATRLAMVESMLNASF